MLTIYSATDAVELCPESKPRRKRLPRVLVAVTVSGICKDSLALPHTVLPSADGEPQNVRQDIDVLRCAAVVRDGRIKMHTVRRCIEFIVCLKAKLSMEHLIRKVSRGARDGARNVCECEHTQAAARVQGLMLSAILPDALENAHAEAAAGQLVRNGRGKLPLERTPAQMETEMVKENVEGVTSKTPTSGTHRIQVRSQRVRRFHNQPAARDGTRHNQRHGPECANHENANVEH